MRPYVLESKYIVTLTSGVTDFAHSFANEKGTIYGSLQDHGLTLKYNKSTE